MATKSSTKPRKQKQPRAERELKQEIKDAVLSEVRKAGGKPAKTRPKRPQRNQDHSTGRRISQTFSEQLVTAIPGATSVVTTVITINPGDANAFPRLFQVAKLYTYWKFKRLTIKWMPNGSAFAAANQTGEVVLAYTNDFYGAPPTSVPVARSRAPNVVGEAWMEKTLHVPKELLDKVRYVRDSQSTGAADARLYDALVYLMAAGTPTNGSIGYLTIDGEVEFWEDYTPNTLLTLGPLQNRATFMLQNVSQALTTGVSAFLNNYQNISSTSVLTGVVMNPSTSSLTATFSPGTYKMTTQVMVSATAVTQVVLNSTAGGFIQGTTAMLVQQGSANLVTRVDWVVVAEGGIGTWVPAITVTGSGTVQLLSYIVTIETLG